MNTEGGGQKKAIEQRQVWRWKEKKGMDGNPAPKSESDDDDSWMTDDAD